MKAALGIFSKVFNIRANHSYNLHLPMNSGVHLGVLILLALCFMVISLNFRQDEIQ